MRTIRMLSSVACASLFIATGAVAEIEGVQPGTSSNPKDNVPEKIQRSTLGEASYPPGSSGPGTRSDELVDMKKEKSEPVTLDDLEKNVEKTHGGGSAVAAEQLEEKSMPGAKKNMKRERGGTAAARDNVKGAPKTERQMFRKENSAPTLQGQQLINQQPTETQQPANRPASERSGSQK